MAKTNSGDSYENLANAIVFSAVADYRKALKKYSKNPGSKSVKADLWRDFSDLSGIQY